MTKTAKQSLRTPEQILTEFRLRGISIAHWARVHGFSPQLVYRVLGGHEPTRGQSHEIAVSLGMKNGKRDGINGFDSTIGNN